MSAVLAIFASSQEGVMAGFLSSSLQDDLKTLLSGVSFVATLYFWMVRANRERVSLGIYTAGGFEGELHPGGVGVWTGRLFIANRSTMPTAIIDLKVELYWDGYWRSGCCHALEPNDLPWNLTPSQVTAKTVTAAVTVGDVACDRVYEPQRLRFTLVTVEGKHVTQEVRTGAAAAASARAA
jgi:hypothetical protein